VTSTPADEIRRRLLLSLWNSYSFLSNYARLDGFDPNTPPVPLPQRQDIDRWILSDLQLVIREAREHFEVYNLPPVCHRVEKFLDDLSTWYIRRNRRRFWRGASEGDTDKLAAYQTLYEVIVTLCKVMAPIVPFVSEHIYQRLVARQIEGSPESVHLCDYPQADEQRIDHALSDAMAAVLRVVSLARSARTASKLKVRQPLAELVVVPADEHERKAVERFKSHFLEELNVKTVTLRDQDDDVVTITVSANMKTLNPKLGRKAAAAKRAIERLYPGMAAEAVEQGRSLTIKLDGNDVQIEAEDVKVEKSFGEHWAGAIDGQTIVLLDKRVTPELKNEGLARDIVRNVQNLRKDAGLNIEDRILLGLICDADSVKAAINQCRDYIRQETLAVDLADTSVDGELGATETKIDRQPLKISLAKA
jgi:isoleucyl-tRNA synthetase